MSWGWDDFWTTSPAERERDEHKRIVHDVEDAAAAIRSDLIDLRHRIHQALASYQDQAGRDATSGRIRVGFEAALDRWARAVDQLIGPEGSLTVACDQLDRRRSLLVKRKEALVTMCHHEDQAQKQFSQVEVDQRLSEVDRAFFRYEPKQPRR
jgi:hypothetical protein